MFFSKDQNNLINISRGLEGHPRTILSNYFRMGQVHFPYVKGSLIFHHWCRYFQIRPVNLTKKSLKLFFSVADLWQRKYILHRIVLLGLMLNIQSTAMVMLERSVQLTTYFFWASLTKRLTSTLCTCNLQTTMIEEHPRIIPVKFGEIANSQFGGDACINWSNCWWTDEDRWRTSNNHKILRSSKF